MSDGIPKSDVRHASKVLRTIEEATHFASLSDAGAAFIRGNCACRTGCSCPTSDNRRQTRPRISGRPYTACCPSNRSPDRMHRRMRVSGRRSARKRDHSCEHRQNDTRGFHDAGSMLMHSDNRAIDHLYSGIVGCRQCVYDAVQTLARRQRTKRFGIWQGPNISRRSRQGAPERKTQKMLLRTRGR